MDGALSPTVGILERSTQHADVVHPIEQRDALPEKIGLDLGVAVQEQHVSPAAKPQPQVHGRREAPVASQGDHADAERRRLRSCEARIPGSVVDDDHLDAKLGVRRMRPLHRLETRPEQVRALVARDDDGEIDHAGAPRADAGESSVRSPACAVARWAACSARSTEILRRQR